MKEKTVIGSTELVDFGKRAQKVPAKIDTVKVRRIIMVRYLRELIILWLACALQWVKIRFVIERTFG